MANDEPEKLYTLNEVAEFLGLSRSTIYKKVSNREIASVRIKKRVYVTVAQLKQYIKDYGVIREAE